METREKTCVCCSQSMRPSVPVHKEKEDDEEENGNGGNRGGKRRTKSRVRATLELQLEEGQEQNDDADELVEDDEEVPLVPIPCTLCEAATGPVQHYAHEDCLEKLKAEGGNCPRCQHAKDTMNIALPDGGVRYCEHVNGGFIGSSKINAAVEWYHSVPKEDKVRMMKHLCLYFLSRISFSHNLSPGTGFDP